MLGTHTGVGVRAADRETADPTARLTGFPQSGFGCLSLHDIIPPIFLSSGFPVNQRLDQEA